MSGEGQSVASTEKQFGMEGWGEKLSDQDERGKSMVCWSCTDFNWNADLATDCLCGLGQVI